jgi:UDP-glucose 4-epimerase
VKRGWLISKGISIRKPKTSMHILITGGAGFIGSHVTELLLRSGHRITILDDLSSGTLANIPKHSHVTLIKKDLLTLSPDEWPGELDSIIHLAALPSVGESWGKLRRAHEINLTGVVHVLEAARRHAVPRFIFASSAAVYGNATIMPLKEDVPTNPLSPYGLHKLAGEQYGRLIAQESGMVFIALRIFNAYGARQPAASPYSGVITRFVEAMRAEKPLTIRGDGSQTRDFVYVKDVASAFAAALEIPRGGTLTCNIGSGAATSVLELARTLQRLIPNEKAPVEFVELLPGEVLASKADISKATDELSFSPQWTLEKGLADMIGV